MSIIGIDILEQKVEVKMGTSDAEEKTGETTEGEDQSQSRKENKGRIKFKTAMLTLLENWGRATRTVIKERDIAWVE